MTRNIEATGKGSEEPPVPTLGPAFEGRTVRHGTPSGHRQHQLDGTEPCNACRMAKAHYDWRWRQSGNATKKNRLRAKAQSIAATRLRNAHQSEYDELYAEEVARLFKGSGLEPPMQRKKKRQT